MKQPLMTIPPAQAEALYDAALENNELGKRSRFTIASTSAGEWDDEATLDAGEDEAFRKANRFLSVPLRTAFRTG
jgi:nitrogen fixation protein FixH